MSLNFRRHTADSVKRRKLLLKRMRGSALVDIFCIQLLFNNQPTSSVLLRILSGSQKENWRYLGPELTMDQWVKSHGSTHVDGSCGSCDPLTYDPLTDDRTNQISRTVFNNFWY